MASSLLFSSLLFSSLLFSLLLTTSCEKESLPDAKTDSEDNPVELHPESELQDGMIQLGKKMDNPYSVENMRQALQNLLDEGMLKSSSAEEQTIETTHLYVRFLPADTLEYLFLSDSLDLMLYDYPLDHEITEDGSYYHDPAIPEDQFTWFYTTVDADFSFPAVKHEILAECYIPEEDEDDEDDEDDEELKSSGSRIKALLEDRALLNAGYAELAQKHNTDDELKLKRKRPQGTIQVWDNQKNNWEPVRGVTIRCQLGVKIGRGATNESGFYKVNRRFRMGPHYRLFFNPNSPKYRIRNNIIVLRNSHSYGLGYHNKRGYSRKIKESSSAAPFCIISNAAFDYYEWCHDNNIKMPPMFLRIWAGKNMTGNSAPMMSKVHYPVHINNNSGWSNFFANISITPVANVFWYAGKLMGISPDITLKTSSSHLDMYRTTCHELAHASHFQNAGSWYWTQYISYIMTYRGYGDASKKNSGICGVGEMWGYYVGGMLATEEYAGTQFTGDNQWFEPRILRQLGSNAQTWRPRLTNPLSEKQIYDCLTSNVKSHEQLKNRLISKYERDEEITAVFAEFGF